MAKKIFVTGGAGFIGSHVVDTWLARGYEVTAFDNLSSGLAQWIEPHHGHPRFQFVRGDLTDLPTLCRALEGHDVVWHLGANTDIPGGIEDTQKDLRDGVVATHTLLEAMRRTGVRDILFTSTGAIYGEMDGTPRRETFGPLRPLSLYAAGKLACEGLISAYCNLFDLRAWIFRLGNVVGLRLRHGVIYDFVQRLRDNPHELVVLGDGRQEKNYFLVEECIDGMQFVYEKADVRCDIFNLGSSGTTLVTKIAAIVIEEMGLRGVPIRYTGGEYAWKGDQPRVYMNVEKVTKLGWTTRYSSDEAVRIHVRRLMQT